MNWLLWSLVAWAAYFTVGRIAARALAPRLAEWAREHNGLTSDARADFLMYRSLLRYFWPISLPFWRSRFADKAAWDRYDPEAIRSREKEQAARIADLERELRLR